MNFKLFCLLGIFIFYLFFTFKEKKNNAVVEVKNQQFIFDSSWYHKVEDSLLESVKEGTAENGKLYVIRGHKFRWTLY